MTRKPRAVTKQIERLIESALMPGRFISHHADFSFIEELGTVEKQLAKLISTDPAQAVSLYETFLAGCYEKAEEIDGSSGSFGQFVGELYCGWMRGWRTTPTASAMTWRRRRRRRSTGPGSQPL